MSDPPGPTRRVPSHYGPVPEEHAGMYRVGNFVERSLLRALKRAGCAWPLSVDWNQRRIRAAITRGELALHTSSYRTPWWEPVARTTAVALADELAAVLIGTWKLYQEADETGRLHVSLWRGEDGTLYVSPQGEAEEVAAVLEPGVQLGTVNGGRTPRVYRFGEDYGLRLQEAVAEGWVKVG